MSNNSAAVRSLVIYAVCLPLAIILGYLICDPADQTTDVVFGVVLLLLLLPLLFRWYHAWLIAVWNMGIVITFLPGMFPGWMPLAGLTFCIALGHYALSRERRFIDVPSVRWPLVILGLVVLITAKLRGGFGFHAFGDESVGGKRYFWIWMAIVGYFVLTSQAVPPRRRKFYVTLFLLGMATQAIGDLSIFTGPAQNFLSVFFPTANASDFVANPFGTEIIERFGGIAAGGVAISFVLVARYGIQGVLDIKKTWRPVLFFSCLCLSTIGGFRSLFISTLATLVLVFFFEGVWRSRLLPAVLLGLLLAAGLTVCFSDHLPLSCQRCLAFLPLKIDPVARLNAEGSTTWRLEIWQALLPQIPHYLWLGKGLTFDFHDMAMYMTLGNQQVGGEVGGEFALVGDYHNGPLSLIIPFGLWGTIAFFWFLVSSIKVLWANHKYGDPEIRTANTFLLSYFLAKVFLFFVIFGGFYSDTMIFTGLVGLSISLNGGVAKPVLAEQPQPVFNRFRPFRLARPAPGS